MLGVSAGETVKDPFTVIRKFRQDHGLTYPIVSDQAGTQIRKFGFEFIPSTVVLDRTGRYVANPSGVDGIVKVVKKLVH